MIARPDPAYSGACGTRPRSRRDEMMQPKDMLKQMIDFNKSAYENAFKNMNMLQEQMEKVITLYIDQSSGMSEEGKKAAKEWTSMYKKGYDDFKKLVDDNFKKMESFFQEKK
jgi:hypothetical protein